MTKRKQDLIKPAGSHLGEAKTGMLPERSSSAVDAQPKPVRDTCGYPAGAAAAAAGSGQALRKRAEEKLWESEAKYRAIVEITDTGFVILDCRGRVVDANSEYVRLTGHSELGEILGRCVTEWTAEHEKERNTKAGAQCMRDGQIRGLIIDYVGSDGRITPTEINATVHGDGKSLRIITLCRDITERKKAEAALTDEHNLYMDLVKSLPAGVYRLHIRRQKPWKKREWVGKVESNCRIEVMSNSFCQLLDFPGCCLPLELLLAAYYAGTGSANGSASTAYRGRDNSSKVTSATSWPTRAR
jgi:PAS domain S-box-containing protein